MMSLPFLLIGLIFFANQCGVSGGSAEGSENYFGYRIYSAKPLSRDAAKSFEYRAVTELNGTSIMKNARGVNDSIDILVPPYSTKDLESLARQLEIPLTVLDEDFQRTLNLSELSSRRSLRAFSLLQYNSYQEINRYLEMLAERNPGIMTYEYRGRSYEGREMKLVRLSSDPKRRKPAIFIDAGIHAREWVAPFMALQLVHALVENPKYKGLLRDLNWYVLPVVNPDGYEFSRSSIENRFWRQTRSQTAVPGCFGVDGNRNYGYKFGVSGVSTDPCDIDIYAGPKPFSESETRIVRDIILNTKDLKLYVSLHCYGQFLLYPWGYTDSTFPTTQPKLNKLAQKVSDSVVRNGGKPFRVMSGGQWYPAAGGSDDYAFAVGGVPYSYTMELTDDNGFLFPESELKNIVSPYLAGFHTFADEILAEFRHEYI